MNTSEMSGETIAARAYEACTEACTSDEMHEGDESRRILGTLKRYFASRDDVVVAFLFGSHARGRATRRSDVDVAVYFAGAHDLARINGVAGELEALLHKDVDLIVLNEANASVAWAALRGIPLVIRDRAFYLQYMLDVSREAEDFSELLYDLWGLRRAHHHTTKHNHAEG
ncbi:MAG: nucleotidyltransferase domain-containing protein [Firmicutes bacterium]|nr:nucleotidyltransferase domain-containing protein [Bacillota bacterium]MDH7496249.1 nucleotidyltransferase domain-containing protein [Bacillota bacterium]